MDREKDSHPNNINPNHRNNDEEIRNLPAAPNAAGDSDIPSELGTRNNSPINLDEWVAGSDPFSHQPLHANDMFSPFHTNVSNNNNGSGDRELYGMLTVNACATPLEQEAAGREPIPPSSFPPARPCSLTNTEGRLADFGGSTRKRRAGQEDSERYSNSEELTTSTNSNTNSENKPMAKRKKKPKGMPKRPLSAYNLFFQAQRPKIQAEREGGDENGPRIGFEELGKIIGKLWRDLDSAEKKVYEKLADKDGERYRKEMDAYNEMKNKRYEEEANRPLSACATSTMVVAPALDVSKYGHGTSSHLPSPHHQRYISNVPSESGPQEGSGAHGFVFGSDHKAAPPSATLSYNPMDAPQQNNGSSQPSPAQNLRRTISQGVPYPPVGPNGVTQLRNPSSSAPSPFNFDGSDPTAIANANYFPLPPGMEIVLSDSQGVDRKYRVHYTCYSMTREAAHQYLESLTGAAVNNGSNVHQPRSVTDASPRVGPAPMQAVPQPHMSQQHYNGRWGI
ncbi:HMG high mobility group box-containing protein [Nitzschia inconspicua]|uniref:HMG high mobility group box-containing protein n=1 Tax=Nitzschia inconspicua TaxID=303405 RepID=A0A9K3KPN3_9STRA|nr:HMG high mobility group box-containing protein [Nitzschia inconspicua]